MSKFKSLSLFTILSVSLFSTTSNATSSADSGVSSGAFGKESQTWCERDCSYEYHFFKRFAGQGSSLANLSLAIMNYRGHGREIDVEAGNSYLFKAARAEEPLAMYQVGYFLLYGLYVKQDIERSLTWFKKASQHNIFNSGQMVRLLEGYLSGEKTEQVKQIAKILEQPALSADSLTGYKENEKGDIERISVVLGFTWEQALEVARQQTCKTNCDTLWGYMLYPRIRVVNEQPLLDLVASTNK